jgi:signal transduction histidine kinase
MIIFTSFKPLFVHMLRKFLIIPVLLINVTFPAFSSGTLTDSLLLLAGKAEADERVRLLNKLARLHLDLHPESSLRYSSMALDASRTTGDLSDRAEALINIGAAWVSRGDLANASPPLEEAFSICRKRLAEQESARDLCRMAQILMLRGKPDSSIALYQRALAMAEADGPRVLSGCLEGLAEAHWKAGRFMQSLESYAQSLEVLERTGTILGKDRLLYYMALNDQRLGRYDEALRNLFASLEVSRELQNLIQLGHTCRVAGSIFLELQNLENALEYHRKGLSILEQIGDLPGVADALEVLADIHMELEEHNEALRLYNRSHDYRRRVGNKRRILNSQMKLGGYFTRRQNYPLAMSYYRDAMEQAEALQDNWALARVSADIGELYRARKDFTAASPYLENALSIAAGMDAKDIMLDACHGLYELHKSSGDYRQSLAYYLRYADMREEVMNVESRTSIANLESSYQLLSKEKEIERLEKENIANQLELQQERGLRNYLVSLAVFLLVLGIIITLYLIRNRRMNLMLKQKNQELEDINARLTRYSEELDGLNRTKNRLISIISHDLKNPFHSLMGFSDLLVREADRFSEEEKLSFYKSINDTSKKAYELLQNLLDWTRLQTSEIPFHPADLHVSDTIQSVLDLLNSHARDKGIAIQAEVPQDTLVYADSRMFETVLRNLVSNAVKFTPYGGKISIAALDLDEQVRFDIEDTGVGMDEEQVAHLFDVDRKASRPGTNNEVGTGFGLILCREFVMKNGGKLWVESAPGNGSTFSFTVPRRRPA